MINKCLCGNCIFGNIICLLNDNYKINIVYSPNYMYNILKKKIHHREKKYMELNDNELKYTKICFMETPNLKYSINKEYKFGCGCECLCPVTILLQNIIIDHYYDVKILNELFDINCSSIVKDNKILETKINYLKDCELYKKTSIYVIPKINQLFNNKLTIQKYLFILTPANCGSSMVSSLIDSSKNTSFGGNIKFEGLLEIKPRPFISLPENWYNDDFKPDYSEILKIKWEDKLIKCDKYPPYMTRANDIEKYFSNIGEVYFICSEMHPYSCYHQIPYDKRIKVLIHNLKTLKNVHLLRYEDLINDFENEKKKLIEFLPELYDLNPNLVKTKHSSRGYVKGIVNCSKFTKSNKSSFNEKYMNALGYSKNQPYLIPNKFSISNLLHL